MHNVIIHLLVHHSQEYQQLYHLDLCKSFYCLLYKGIHTYYCHHQCVVEQPSECVCVCVCVCVCMHAYMCVCVYVCVKGLETPKV